MSTIIVKKKTGEKVLGSEIAKKNWFREDSNDNSLYPTNDFHAPQVLYSPTDKVSYLIAELNTMAEEARDGRKRKRAAKLFGHIKNLERRFCNYVPGCSGFYRHRKWYYEDIPDGKQFLYPDDDYGHISQQVGILSDFLGENNIDEFDFICDSRYIIVLEGRGTNWEGMKAAGLIDIHNIEMEYTGLR